MIHTHTHTFIQLLGLQFSHVGWALLASSSGLTSVCLWVLSELADLGWYWLEWLVTCSTLYAAFSSRAYAHSESRGAKAQVQTPQVLEISMQTWHIITLTSFCWLPRISALILVVRIQIPYIFWEGKIHVVNGINTEKEELGKLV